MYELTNLIPLVINFPAEADLTQEYLAKKIQQNRADYELCASIANMLAKGDGDLAIDPKEISVLELFSAVALVSPHRAVLHTDLKYLLQYARDCGFSGYLFQLQNGKAWLIKPPVHSISTPPYTPSGQVEKFFDSSEIKETETYRSELKKQIEASTAQLADLLHCYQESLELAYKNKHLDDNQACNLMLDLDNTVAAALFTNRWTGHLGKIAACLSSRYYPTSWGE